MKVKQPNQWPGCESPDHFINLILTGLCHTCLKRWEFKPTCGQCGLSVEAQDYDPQAGLCNACIAVSMNEATEFFTHQTVETYATHRHE